MLQSKPGAPRAPDLLALAKPPGFEPPKTARAGEVKVRSSEGVHLDQSVTRLYSWTFIGGINRSGGGTVTTRIRITDDPKEKE